MREALQKFLRIYQERRGEVASRIEEFKRLGSEGLEDDVFAELCFCICTPQSRARAADVAISRLRSSSLLWDGDVEEVSKVLQDAGVRFPDKKARYIVGARVYKRVLRELPKDALRARELLVKNVKGLGYKEASHLLRNIGYSGIAVLDRHILRGMVEIGILESVPKSLTKKMYLELERKFLDLASSLGMMSEGLDLVMWAAKTGEVFK